MFIQGLDPDISLNRFVMQKYLLDLVPYMTDYETTQKVLKICQRACEEMQQKFNFITFNLAEQKLHMYALVW